MKCPACNIDLKMADRQGVEIDYCPQCRGVWLDRGELDKIIERSDTTRPYGDGEHDDQKLGDYRREHGDYDEYNRRGQPKRIPRIEIPFSVVEVVYGAKE